MSWALMLDRLCHKRDVLPSAGIVDSQSVKVPAARTRGYDANKKLRQLMMVLRTNQSGTQRGPV